MLFLCEVVTQLLHSSECISIMRVIIALLFVFLFVFIFVFVFVIVLYLLYWCGVTPEAQLWVPFHPVEPPSLSTSAHLLPGNQL